MSRSPDITISWGDEWRRSQRNHVRPVIQDATELALEGFDCLGVTLLRPKEIAVRRTVRNFEDQGSLVSDGLIELYLDAVTVKRQKVPALLGRLSVVSFHEMIHDERYFIYPRDDLLEYVATEGLAYYADTLFANNFLHDHEHPDAVADSLAMEKLAAMKFLENLYADAETQANLSEEQGLVLHDGWMTEENPIFDGYSTGDILGIRCVGEHIKQGATIAEMMHWAPERIVVI